MPGIWELAILGFLALFAVAAAVAVVAVVLVSSRPKKPASYPQQTPCPGCHNLVSIHAAACPKCGCPLVPPKMT